MSRTSISKKSFGRKLTVESLETREMLAGNVVASLAQNGTLTLTGDPADNNVQVSESPRGSGTWCVQPNDSSGITTRINQATKPVNFKSVKFLRIYLGAGNDSLLLQGTLPADVANLGARVQIDMGSGNNAVRIPSLVSTPVPGQPAKPTALPIGLDSIQATGGNNSITLQNVNWAGNRWLIQTFGNGDSSVSITNSQFAASPQSVLYATPSLTVNTGAGNDSLMLDHVTVDRFGANLGGGNDFAQVTSCAYTYCTLDGSSGWNGLYAAGNTKNLLYYGFQSVRSS